MCAPYLDLWFNPTENKMKNYEAIGASWTLTGYLMILRIMIIMFLRCDDTVMAMYFLV